MKKILIILFLILGSIGFANAQTDYCKDITKRVDKELSMTSYESPGTFLTIGKNRVDDEGHFGPISLHFVCYNHSADYEAYGLYVTFADGTLWKEDGAHIDCSYMNTDIGYRFGASKLLHEEQLELFKTKK
ncbi:hypothetical protein ACFGVR_10395 [Mucilaginibacter sp. AW1-3]